MPPASASSSKRSMPRTGTKKPPACGRYLPYSRLRLGTPTTDTMTLPELQQMIRAPFGAKDASRGIDGTFMWFMQEVGELATALRSGTAAERAQEFADVLAWLATL